MREYKAEMDITKTNKYNKKNQHQYYNEDKNKQVHLQVKIHNEHLKNIIEISKYKKTELQSIKE